MDGPTRDDATLPRDDEWVAWAGEPDPVAASDDEVVDAVPEDAPPADIASVDEWVVDGDPEEEGAPTQTDRPAGASLPTLGWLGRWRPRARTLTFGVALALVTTGAVHAAGSVTSLGADAGGPDAGSVPGADDASGAAAAARPAPPAADLAEGAAVATSFLRAWEDGRHEAMADLVAGPSRGVAEEYDALADRLGISELTTATEPPDPATGTVPFTVTAVLDDVGPVSWQSAVRVEEIDRGWVVRWTPDTVYPGLGARDQLDLVDLPSRGDVLDRRGRPLSDDADLVASVVGTVAPEGDGGSGLQRAFDGELSGKPSPVLAVVREDTGEVVRVVDDGPDTSENDLTTTLDLDVQEAAVAALRDVEGRSALVALDTGSGEVLAAADDPVTGWPGGLRGAYPPGAAFTIVTATAALTSGYTAAAASCPGREPGGGEPVTLSTAFATGCEAAFVEIADGLPDPALIRAAESLGFNTGGSLPVPSSGGSLPTGADPASAAVGRGGVTASPLHMASVAAAAATGIWHQPRVVECEDCDTRPVPNAVLLQPMMRAAVTDGTGRAVAGVPGEPAYGQTATVDVDGSPHGWFVGWQGDIAVAVLAEDGDGAESASAAAARFLTLLAES